MTADLLWDLAGEMEATDPRVAEGTIMGGRCLRLGGEFLAMPYHKGDGLVVKLPTERVTALIDTGVGAPFAPAGRTFTEWVLVTEPDEELWRTLLDEAKAFMAVV